MANGIRTGNPVDSIKDVVRQTPEEGWKTYQLKRCENNNKDEDNSPKTLNDKNQALSQQFIDKHLKKAGGHISRNIVEITIKLKTIVQKHLMIKIIKLLLRNFDNSTT